MENNEPILVTKAFLPELSEYTPYLKKLWKSRWLTNNGTFARELEEKLAKRMNVKHVFFVSNGTIALQLAIKALDLKKEIITTPFSYVATTNSILWERCKPVFVDIDPETLCIDPEKIENAITKNTQAILAVHVFGQPCDVGKIEKIAKKHNLKVIYDGAHAFDVTIDGSSVFNFGDISTLSFHATKLFHTGEGGAVITNDDKLAHKIKLLRSFGQDGDDFVEVGINAKNSEFHATLGLANLKFTTNVRKMREKVFEAYNYFLKGMDLKLIPYFNNVSYNYSYYPVVFKSEHELLTVKRALEAKNIQPRRYFFPSLNTLSFLKGEKCPVSEDISKRILCLPIYHDLQLEKAQEIAAIVSNIVGKRSSKKKSIPSLSIGIPAHNEGKNIRHLIASIFQQNGSEYLLEKVYVICDGCTDDTVQKVQKIMETYPKVRLLNDGKRKGKTSRLNEIYKKNTSELLLTLDGDVALGNTNVINLLVKKMLEKKAHKVISGNLLPIKPRTFSEKIIYQNHVLWNHIRFGLSNSNHIANLYGSANLLKNSFSKTIKYPTNITADEEFLYMSSYKNNGFGFEKNAQIYYKTAASFKELAKQGRRYKTERFSLTPYFGEEVLDLHHIPLSVTVRGIAISFATAPILTTCAIAYNVYLKITPFFDEITNSGTWEIATSTKLGLDK